MYGIYEVGVKFHPLPIFTHFWYFGGRARGIFFTFPRFAQYNRFGSGMELELNYDQLYLEY
jgi:hypothetical protein